MGRSFSEHPRVRRNRDGDADRKDDRGHRSRIAVPKARAAVLPDRSRVAGWRRLALELELLASPRTERDPPRLPGFAATLL